MTLQRLRFRRLLATMFVEVDAMAVDERINKGVVVPKNGPPSAAGARAPARSAKKAIAKAPSKPRGRRRLLRHAGKASDLPADAARNLDHYLYGHAKK